MPPEPLGPPSLSTKSKKKKQSNRPLSTRFPIGDSKPSISKGVENPVDPSPALERIRIPYGKTLQATHSVASKIHREDGAK